MASRISRVFVEIPWCAEYERVRLAVGCIGGVAPPTQMIPTSKKIALTTLQSAHLKKAKL
jgi:hypothetical protein